MPYGKDSNVFMLYLAGPVDGVSIEESSSWRELVSEEFPNVVFFMPNDAYRNITSESVAAADHMNRHAIKCSDAVVANLSGDGRGFGTIREIEFARALEKRVCVAAGPELNTSLMAYDIAIYDSPVAATQGALEWLTDRLNSPPIHPLLGRLGLYPNPGDDDEL